MSSDQSLLDFKVLLSKHKQNENLYKQKIKQINQTRSKISDQFEFLQQTYDKKLKTLENKLESFKNQNQNLIKQNIIYKAEIQNYQSRLIQKQKIIGVLLGQKKDIVISSDRSKSEKTESLNALEEDHNKFNKKNNNKDKQQLNILNKIKYSGQKSKIDVQSAKELTKEVQLNFDKIQENRLYNQTKGSNLSQKMILVNETKNEEVEKQQQNFEMHEGKKEQQNNYSLAQRVTFTQKKQKQQNNQFPDIIINPIKNIKKPKKKESKNSNQPPPIKKKRTNRYLEQFQYEEKVDQSYNKDKQLQVLQRNGDEQVGKESECNNDRIERQQLINNDMEQLNMNRNQLNYNEQQQQIKKQQKYQYHPQDNILTHFNQNKQNNLQNHHFLTHQSNHYQIQQTQQSENNLLSHFTNNILEITSQPYTGKVLNRNKKKKKANELEQSINTSNMINSSQVNVQSSEKDKNGSNSSRMKMHTAKQEHEIQNSHYSYHQQPSKNKYQPLGNAIDFFSSLQQDTQTENHNFQILQSSIDHIQRDSSIISNQQPYFADMNVEPKQKQIKMPKKKGKRDQIKQVYPSMFQ